MSVPPWVTRLPPGWSAKPLRHLATIRNSNVDKKSYEDGVAVRLCNYTDVYKNEYITGDMELMEATATASEIERFELRAGDVIITKDSETWDDIAVPACVPESLPGVVCGYHLTLLRPHRTQVDGRFLLRALQAQGVREQFWLTANGVTRFGLCQDGMKEALIPLPPLPVQRAIADFLDRKTTAIDALIVKKERLLRLLAEKRATLIQHVVTRGLDPGVPTQNSTVRWIETIPSHWRVMRLRHISPELTVGVVVNPSSYVDDSGDVPFIYGSDVRPGVIDVSGARRITQSSNRLLKKSMLRAGDLVTVRVGAPGITAVVPQHLDGINCASIMLVRQHPSFASHWLEYVMNSAIGAANVAVVAYGAAQKQFNISHAVDFVVPVPPLEEQVLMVDHLRRRCNEIDRACQLAALHIDRLGEYRRTLITTAVTGEIEVAANGATSSQRTPSTVCLDEATT